MRKINRDSVFMFVRMSVNCHFKGREGGEIGLRRLEGLSVHETGSESCPVADFGKSNVELPASFTAVITYVQMVKIKIVGPKIVGGNS